MASSGTATRTWIPASAPTTEYGALDAYFPAVLAFSGYLDQAKRLQDSSYRMWDLNGIEPEVLDYKTMQVEYPGYELRPEIVESTYYLYHYTHDPCIRNMRARCSRTS